MPMVLGVADCRLWIATAALAILLLPAEILIAGVSEPDISVVINEILAANGTAGHDPQYEYDDWIELYNAGDNPVDLAGCYLTDDLAVPTKWQFLTNAPTVTTVAPGGYLLIWADGETTAAGLHAGFRLSDDGEQIGLFAPDGTTLIDGFSFGKQTLDISYGRYPDGGPDLRLLVPPTPGAPNITAYEGVTEQPQASPASGLCTTAITITLTTATEGATIFYSLDGTDPFSEARGRGMGSVYTGPIRIGRTVTLKAVAWRYGWRQSPTCTERYVFVDSEVRNFSSPVAIAIVDTMGKSVSRPQVPAYGYFFDTDEQGTATMGEEIDFAGRAAINIRGKSSEGFPKHQYHFETWDERNNDKSVSILGLPAESDWVFQGPYADKSLMRNFLAYQWSNEIGRYAPRTRFVELFLNTGNDAVSMSDYLGVYVFMEKIKLGPDRVDVGEPPADPTGSAITGGYIVKKDKLDGDDVTFSTSRGQTLVYSDPNGYDLSQAERDWIRSFMNAFEAALYGSSFTDPASGYSRFIDVGSFIDHHIVVETAKNIDGFRLSTYMHIDHAGILHMGPVWDYDLSLGNANYADGWNATGWYYRQVGDGDYPYWRRLFQDPEFRLAYADRWFELRRDLFTTDRMMQRIEDHAALLNEPSARNFQRWNILGIYVWPNWFIAKTWREEVDWMKGWLADRLKWMDSQIAIDCSTAAPPSFSRQGGHVTPGSTLAMSAAFGGAVYYSVDGSDPRLFSDSAAATDTVLLLAENAAKRVLVPTGPAADAWRGGTTYDDSAWTLVTGDPGGVGFERSTGYEGYITCDVGSQMYDIQSSCYVRIPFTFPNDIADVAGLTLRVRYDDGFIAYLNGIEIARRSFAGTPAWNSVADTIHDDTAAVNFEDIPIPGFAQALRTGDNLLALHAMNQSTTSSDFLISVELTADERIQAPTYQVQKYVSPISITRTTRVKARTLSGSKWSALNEAVFAVGPVAANLRISEILYHPAEAGNPDDPNSEY
ncbi:MAG: CotH kinase family protein, partial [Sedimentisphaerales bacterium]|nr:CotH kinase family protein [Sedimentisphaerales bacterium]